MATDRQLSRNFWLHEFAGWQKASEDQVDQLEEFVAVFLQPLRDREGIGRIVPTSWRWWSSGRERSGAHARGAVDFVGLDNSIDELWAAARTLEPWRFRQIIHERDHIHAVPPGVDIPGSSTNGTNGEILREPREGFYVYGNADPLLVSGLAVLAVLAVLWAAWRW